MNKVRTFPLWESQNRLVFAIRRNDSRSTPAKIRAFDARILRQPRRREVVTRIRDYDPENLFVCFLAHASKRIASTKT